MGKKRIMGRETNDPHELFSSLGSFMMFLNEQAQKPYVAVRNLNVMQNNTGSKEIDSC